VSDPALAIQKAYVARLKTEGSVNGRVYDEAPQNVVFPYLQIGDIQTVEDGVDCLDSTEVTVTLHVWSRKVGRVEARSLAATCRAALHNWIPNLGGEGFRCVDHMHRSTRVFADSDGKTSHGVLTFRLLVDPV
jgi:hypothetical protein